MSLSRKERLKIYFEQLADAPVCSSPEEAFQQLSDILNKVEDEHTNIPYNPDKWKSDGRMYPPQEDNIRKVSDRSKTIKYRTKGHVVYAGFDGALIIESCTGEVLFNKKGTESER